MARVRATKMLCKRCEKSKSATKFRGPYATVCVDCWARAKKTCKGCDLEKPPTDFYPGRGLCKECRRNRALWKSYGVTPKEYERMFKKQKGRCAICRCKAHSPRAGKRGVLYVDHNHETGQVRKLLCSRCNHGLGCFADNAKWIKRAAKYLESFAA